MSKLCEDCSGIGVDGDSPNGLMTANFDYLLKPSWVALRKSADAGCECCQWFRYRGPNGTRYLDATVRLTRPTWPPNQENVGILEIRGEDPKGQKVTWGKIDVYTHDGTKPSLY